MGTYRLKCALRSRGWEKGEKGGGCGLGWVGLGWAGTPTAIGKKQKEGKGRKCRAREGRKLRFAQGIIYPYVSNTGSGALSLVCRWAVGILVEVYSWVQCMCTLRTVPTRGPGQDIRSSGQNRHDTFSSSSSSLPKLWSRVLSGLGWAVMGWGLSGKMEIAVCPNVDMFVRSGFAVVWENFSAAGGSTQRALLAEMLGSQSHWGLKEIQMALRVDPFCAARIPGTLWGPHWLDITYTRATSSAGVVGCRVVGPVGYSGKPPCCVPFHSSTGLRGGRGMQNTYK